MNRPHLHHAAALSALLCALSFAGGCGATIVGAPLVSEGRDTRIRDLDVSLRVPAAFDKHKSGVWTLDAGGARHAMLWVQRKDTPKEGINGFVENLAANVGRGGRAGVIRREKVELGDLEGHFIEAVTIFGQQHSAVMQLLVGAEDGLYMVSLVATIDTMRRNHKIFEAVVKSLRVPPR